MTVEIALEPPTTPAEVKMSDRPTRRGLCRRPSDDGDAADIPTLSVVEGLSYTLQWANREAGVVELETGELRRFDARRLGHLAPVVEASVGEKYFSN